MCLGKVCVSEMVQLLSTPPLRSLRPGCALALLGSSLGQPRVTAENEWAPEEEGIEEQLHMLLFKTKTVNESIFSNADKAE